MLRSVIVKMQAGLIILLLVLEIAATTTPSTPVTATTSMTPANILWSTSEGTTTVKPKPKKPKQKTTTILLDIIATTYALWTTEEELTSKNTLKLTTVTTLPDILFSTSMTRAKSVWTIETSAEMVLPPKPPNENTKTPVPDIFSTSMTPAKSVWTLEKIADTPSPPKPKEDTESPEPDIFSTSMTPAKSVWTMEKTADTPFPPKSKENTESPEPDIFSTSMTPAKSVWTMEKTVDTPFPPKPKVDTESPVPDIFSTSMTPVKSVWTLEKTVDTPFPPKSKEDTESLEPDIFSTSMTPAKSVWTMQKTADAPLPPKHKEVAVTPVPDIFSTSMTPTKSVWTMEKSADAHLSPTPEEIAVTPLHDVFSTSMTPAKSDTPMKSTVAMTVTSHKTTDIGYAKMLLHAFVDDCDVKIRPVKNLTQPIKLKTKFVPVSIIEFDTTSQKFSVLGYFRFAWYDETIRWWKWEYNGLRHMIVPSTSVWKPNAIIQKSYDGNGVIGNPDSDQTRIGRSGHTQWVPDGTYSVVCDVDIQYYPFDEQFCKIIYYIADETIDTVELNHDSEVPLTEINENSAWKLLGVSRKKVVQSNNYYIEIEFHLSRRPNYATFTLVVPLLMLASLNMCIFLVPIESGEKGGLAITVFLSYGIFISILSDKLPHNSLQTSFFVVFITLLLVLSVLSVLYSVIQAKLVVSIGANNSVFGCFRVRNPKLNGNQSGEGQLRKHMSWAAFFQKMDIVIFIVFVVIVLIASAGFFCVMLRRITKDKVQI